MPYEFAQAQKLLIQLPPLPPIVRGWRRLEGRPRTVDYERALRAEVRDALWFLTRQWQFGEFRGEDAGTPVDARVVLRQAPLVAYAARKGPAARYDERVPLEVRVEREPIPHDLTMQVQLSRWFFKMIAAKISAARLPQVRQICVTAYPLAGAKLPGFPSEEAGAVLALATRHAMNAGSLLDDVAANAHTAKFQGAGAVSGAEADVLEDAGVELAKRFAALYLQPSDAADNAWAPRFLEYQFACAVEAQGLPQTVLAADEYNSGHLDWYSFDVDTRPEAKLDPGAGVPLPEAEVTVRSFIPAPVSFGGAPHPRYWEMENRRTEFADIDANTVDVAKLLLTEFALVYSNDWCVIPHQVDTGSLSEVLGLMVTNDFGEQVLIRAAGRGIDDRWQRWSMFTLSTNAQEADTRLFVPPALTHSLDGEPVEKVHFLRDEMANMAWAVERVVPTTLGTGISGYDAARIAAGPPPPAVPRHPTPAKVQYVLGTDVPENWFPFVPVHMAASTRSVELQRARMPGENRPIRGAVLNPGPNSYFINEEEVPRAGRLVTRSFQRTRWFDGSTYVWLGRRSGTGRGEGSSNLQFDQVDPVKVATP